MKNGLLGKFKVGDRVILTEDQNFHGKGMTGVIIGNTRHLWGIQFDTKPDWDEAHDCGSMTNGKRGKDGWCWYVDAKRLMIAEIPYDPNGEGETDEDI